MKLLFYAVSVVALTINLCLSEAFALVNGGTMVPHFLSSQANKEGSPTIVAINPFISIDYTFPFFFNHSFNPEIGYVFNTDAEDETTHRTIFLGYNLEYPLYDFFFLRYGFANFISKVGGDGKTVELNNGTSTMTFHTPSDSQTSYTSSFNLGMRTVIMEGGSIRLDLNIMRFLSSERRSLGYLLSYNYNL
jgi:hypothetical protein